VKDLWRLLAHQHWITLRFFKREVRLCARCTGYVIGLVIYSFIRNFFDLHLFYSLSIQSQLYLCSLFAIPLMFDWVTQSWGWRDSNNRLRLSTGAIMGVGVALLLSTEATFNTKAILCFGLASAIVSLGLTYKIFSKPPRTRKIISFKQSS
jgi:uncharacterized membrane protein